MHVRNKSIQNINPEIWKENISLFRHYRYLQDYIKIYIKETVFVGLEIREYGRRAVTLTMWHRLSAEVGTNFDDKLRSLGRYSSLADYGHGVSK
jgi:hypothetical protein